MLWCSCRCWCWAATSPWCATTAGRSSRTKASSTSTPRRGRTSRTSSSWNHASSAKRRDVTCPDSSTTRPRRTRSTTTSRSRPRCSAYCRGSPTPTPTPRPSRGTRRTSSSSAWGTSRRSRSRYVYFYFRMGNSLTAYFVYTTGVAFGAGDGARRPGRLTRHPARGPGAGPSRQRPRPAPVLGRRYLGDEHDGLGRRLELFHVLRDAPRGEFILMLVQRMGNWFDVVFFNR